MRRSTNIENHELMYDHEHPRELLTSEIDLISRMDQFRSSTTSLQGFGGE